MLAGLVRCRGGQISKKLTLLTMCRFRFCKSVWYLWNFRVSTLFIFLNKLCCPYMNRDGTEIEQGQGRHGNLNRDGKGKLNREGTEKLSTQRLVRCRGGQISKKLTLLTMCRFRFCKSVWYLWNFRVSTLFIFLNKLCCPYMNRDGTEIEQGQGRHGNLNRDGKGKLNREGTGKLITQRTVSQFLDKTKRKKSFYSDSVLDHIFKTNLID
jgi:hypothetical protein